MFKIFVFWCIKVKVKWFYLLTEQTHLRDYPQNNLMKALVNTDITIAYAYKNGNLPTCLTRHIQYEYNNL